MEGAECKKFSGQKIGILSGTAALHSSLFQRSILV